MDLKEIERRVLAGERPRLTPEVLEARKTDSILNGMIIIMERCWAQDPLARPPIDQVVRDLEKLAEPADKGNTTTIRTGPVGGINGSTQMSGFSNTQNSYGINPNTSSSIGGSGAGGYTNASYTQQSSRI